MSAIEITTATGLREIVLIHTDIDAVSLETALDMLSIFFPLKVVFVTERQVISADRIIETERQKKVTSGTETN